MISVAALKQIYRQRRAFLATTLILSLMFTLLLAFHTISETQIRSNFSHMYNSKADMWISVQARDKLDGLLFSKSDYEKLRKLDVLSRVEPVFEAPAFLEAKGKRIPVLISSYAPSGLREPRLTEGKAPPWKYHRGLLVDDSIFTTTKLEVGNLVHLGGRDFEIAGLTTDNRYFFESVVQVPYDMLERASGDSDHISFAIAKVRQGVSLQQAKTEIARLLPRARIQTKDEYIQYLSDEISFISGVILSLELMVAVMVLLVLNMTLFNQIMENRTSLAVLRCIGASQARLTGSVILQSLAMSLVALLLAGVWVQLIAVSVHNVLPVRLSSSLSGFAVVFVIMALLSVAGGLIASRSVSRIDPIEATRAL